MINCMHIQKRSTIIILLYTDEQKHYDYLPNLLSVLCILWRHELYKTPEGVLLYLAPRH